MSSEQTNAVHDQQQNMQLTVEYYGDITGDNKGKHIGSIANQAKYSVAVATKPQATIAEFIDAFHQQAGIDKSYTIEGGAPPNRRPFEVEYTHYINNKMVHSDNEHESLAKAGITNGMTLVIRIGGGGMVD